MSLITTANKCKCASGLRNFVFRPNRWVCMDYFCRFFPVRRSFQGFSGLILMKCPIPVRQDSKLYNLTTAPSHFGWLAVLQAVQHERSDKRSRKRNFGGQGLKGTFFFSKATQFDVFLQEAIVSVIDASARISDWQAHYVLNLWKSVVCSFIRSRGDSPIPSAPHSKCTIH